MFQKILIANRGEIAVRIIRACRDMGIISVAVYSEADREALHAQIADEAVCIGPAPAKDSYLNVSAILSAAKGTGCEAVHPGFGFLSENADFARACREHGLVFIGPSPETMDLMGDKIAARRTAKEAGVPVTPGSMGAISDIKEARQIAKETGFPLMLKARSGGGGKGIRKVDSPDELDRAFQTASAEAQASFGDGALYLEKYVENPRHIEFQILSDKEGNTVHLYERECSIQRKHQKLIEESPSPFLDSAMRQKMGECAVKIARACGYENAGTIEFLVSADKSFYFCEMNTRIQVEHPVTECLTGIDLVTWQIRIAAGETLDFTQENVIPRGHVIECRINAEDSRRNFAPCPGHIDGLHSPGGPGVRIDSAAYQGCDISPFYDSMLGKLIVSGNSRDEAIARMERALAEYLFDGITTNVDYQMQIVRSEPFRSGDYHTNTLETL